MFEKIVKGYVAVATKFFIPIALVVIATTWFAFPKVVALFQNIQTEFKSLLPADYESVKRADELSELFGGMKNLEAVFETKDAQSFKKALPKLIQFLESDEEVKEVSWRKPGYDFFDLHKLYYPSVEDLEDMRDRIDRRVQREKLGSLYISFEDDEDKGKDTFDDLKEKYTNTYTGKVTSEFYTNEDETVFVTAIYPKGKDLDVAQFKQFGRHIKGRIADFHIERHDPTARVHYTGGVITSVHQYDSLTRDLRRAGIVSGILILLLILIYFRNLRALFFVSIPLGCGLIWNFAIAFYTIGHLNMTTAFLFSILFGLGIDFGIHLNSRYNEERAGGAGPKEALTTMLLQTGRSSFTAGATTASAFIILVINDFKGFSEFGLIAGIGIMVTLLAYVVILPLMFAFEEKVPLFRRRRFTVTSWRLDRITNLPRRGMLIALASTVAASILLAVLFLRFDYNFANFTARNEAIEKAQELERTVNPQRAVPSVVLVHSSREAQVVKWAIKEKIESNPDTVMNSTRNVHSLVPEDMVAKTPILREIRVLLEDDVIEKLVKGEDKEKIEKLKASAAADPFTLKEIPPDVKKIFVHEESGEKNQLVYIFLNSDVDLKDGKKAIALAEEVRDIPVEDGNIYHATSSSIIFADVLTVMLRDSPKAILLSFLTVFGLLLLDFRSFKLAAVTMVPLVAGITLMLGVMSAVRMDLNFFNMIILPVILGIGIDNGVHFFHRYQEEGYKNLRKVMTTTGGSVVMTTLTTAAGFAGMTMAHHGGLASIGIAADIGMMSCLFTTLFFFPAILAKIWSK